MVLQPFADVLANISDDIIVFVQEENIAIVAMAVMVDMELSYTFADHYIVSIGGENIFDEYPDSEADGTLDFLGAEYAVTSPYGFNGAFWYARFTASF